MGTLFWDLLGANVSGPSRNGRLVWFIHVISHTRHEMLLLQTLQVVIAV